MSEQISVPLRTLSDSLALLLQHLEDMEGGEVRLDKDFFWSIPAEQLYNVYDQPDDLTVGQLSESLENLRGLLADPSKVNSYGLVWLADLLRALGQTVVR